MTPKVIAITTNQQMETPVSPIREDGQIVATSARGRYHESRHKIRRQEMELRVLRSKYEESRKEMANLKQERNDKNKTLLEMSKIVKSLQDVTVDYDRKEGDSSFENVSKKIKAIDKNLTQLNRLKQERDSNKKMLLEMSGLVTALQDISVDYDKTDAGDVLENVQRKIKAIDSSLKEANGHLQAEKRLATSALQAKEFQIRGMTDQIYILQSTLRRVIEDKRQSLDNERGLVAVDSNKKIQELHETIKHRENQMKSMETQVLCLQNQIQKYESEKQDNVTQEIEIVKENNTAKYAEISALEGKLETLRRLQNEQNSQIVLLQKQPPAYALGSHQENNGSAAKYAEIDALEKQLQVLAKIQEEQTSEMVVFKDQETKKDQYLGETKGNDLTMKLNALQGAQEIHNRRVESLKEQARPWALDLITADRQKTEQNELPSEGNLDSFISNQLVKFTGPASSVYSLPLDVIEEDSESQSSSLPCSSIFSSYTSGWKKQKESAIKISSSEDEGVEITVSTDGQIDFSDVSYFTERSCSTENTSVDASSDATDSNTSAFLSSKSSHSTPASTSSTGWETLSLHSGSFDADATKQLLEQLEHARKKYEKLQAVHKAVLDSAKKTEPSSSEMEVLKDDYDTAMARIELLEKDNQKLRASHQHALQSMAEISEVTYKAEYLKKENEELKFALADQKNNSNLTIAKYEKLQSKHTNTEKDQEEEKEKYEQLMKDYQNATRLKDQIPTEDHNKLKRLHDVVVLKVADLGEENVALKVERDILMEKLTQIQAQNPDKEYLIRHEQTVFELEASKRDYAQLQSEHEINTAKVGSLCDQNKKLKEKYNNLVAKDGSDGSDSLEQHDSLLHEYEANLVKLKELEAVEEEKEKLQKEYEANLVKLKGLEAVEEEKEKLKDEFAEALAKVSILEQSNEELENNRAKHIHSEAKVAMLERDLQKTSEKAESSMKKQQEREAHLRDVIFHYKSLEKEHEEVVTKLQRLQAVVAGGTTLKPEDLIVPSVENDESICGSITSAKTEAMSAKIAEYEGRIKELQLQRDEALRQMKDVEDDLVRIKLEAAEAKKCKVDREKDLRIVLQHYQKLQKKFEETVERVEKLETEAARKQEEVETEVARRQKEAKVESNPKPDTIKPVVSARKEKATSEESKKDVSEGDCIPQEEDSNTKKGTGITEIRPKEEPQFVHQQELLEDVDDGSSIAQMLVDMDDLKRQKEARMLENSDDKDVSSVSNVSDSMSVGSCPSSSSSSSASQSENGWKDKKIAQVLGELEEANDRVEDLALQHEKARAQLDNMERKMLIAQREAEDAKKKQGSREVNLRDITIKHKKLERDHKEAEDMVTKLQEQLSHAKKEARVREEEAKAARKRLAGCHFHFKKLQDEHDVVLKRVQQQEEELQELKNDSFLENANNPRNYRNEFLLEKVNLLKENQELKTICDDLLAKMERFNIKP